MHILKTLRLPLYATVIFWIFWFLPNQFHVDLNRYVGLYPRTISGMLGIIFSPLLHGSFIHLLKNTAPFIVLSGMILYFYPKVALRVFLIIYVGTGLAVWLFGRNAYHVGSSGLIYGFAAYLFFSGIFRRSVPAMALSLTVMLLYGASMLEGVLPIKAHISWESHSAGLFTGILSAWYFRYDYPDIFQVNTSDVEVTNEYQKGYKNIENKAIKYFYVEE